MNVIVCVKQIPDPATPYRLEEGTNWLIRPEEQILDDTDRYGVEMGLQLTEPGGGTVTVVSMGPAGSGQLAKMVNQICIAGSFRASPKACILPNAPASMSNSSWPCSQRARPAPGRWKTATRR